MTLTEFLDAYGTKGMSLALDMFIDRLIRGESVDTPAMVAIRQELRRMGRDLENALEGEVLQRVAALALKKGG